MRQGEGDAQFSPIFRWRILLRLHGNTPISLRGARPLAQLQEIGVFHEMRHPRRIWDWKSHIFWAQIFETRHPKRREMHPRCTRDAPEMRQGVGGEATGTEMTTNQHCTRTCISADREIGRKHAITQHSSLLPFRPSADDMGVSQGPTFLVDKPRSGGQQPRQFATTIFGSLFSRRRQRPHGEVVDTAIFCLERGAS
jgi:hypothetical protein